MTWIPSFRSTALAAAAGLVLALPLAALAEDAAGLRAKHSELKEALAHNPYQRPMHIRSTESDNSLQGDVHAVLDHPFEKVRDALRQPDAWCDIMILPFNTKQCQATSQGNDGQLAVRIGRKYNQPVDQAFKIDFQFRNISSSADFMEVQLTAAEGPISTKNYRIQVSAVPLEGGKTFMHLTYSYGYGTTGRLAMQAYLATAGADKVGFSVTGKDANGQPQYTGGVRGAVERNAMRYHLAIDAYLDSLSVPEAQRVERRIQNWFSATERYPRQLREMDRSTYVAMKRQEAVQ